MKTPERRGNNIVARVKFLLDENEPKRCYVCRQPLRGRDFAIDRANVDGRRNECKLCRRIRRSELAEGATRVRPYGLIRLRKSSKSGLIGGCQTSKPVNCDTEI